MPFKCREACPPMDKAVTLVFDLASVEEAIDAEEAGLFGHIK